MIRKVRFGNATIPYSIIKSNRRKTSQITVDKDNVVKELVETEDILSVVKEDKKCKPSSRNYSSDIYF